MNKEKLVSLISARMGTPTAELSAKTVAELEKIVDDSLLAGIRAEAATSPAVLEAQRKLAEIQAERQQVQRDHQFAQIFRTPINGQVVEDNTANRQIISSWISLDEQITVSWFKQVLAENPGLARSLSWQSADVLDPAKRRTAEIAQDLQDRQTFNEFARRNGWSECQANHDLAKSVLGSGFDRYTLADAVRSGQLLLAPASHEELTKFREEVVLARADFLRNHASPAELREAARAEFEQRRIQAQRQESERQFQGREVADAVFGFPALPEIHQPTGEKIDAAWLNKISNTNLNLFKALMRKHGAAALTRRLHGRG